ncbi:O-antigen ligase family protein [Akkermansiaceae bacterium]|nr:O-antigen ligase family protein [Akkermansiaceae bacterium]
MEFVLAVFFLLFYFLRPQDWMPGLIGLTLIKPIIAVWLGVLLANRSLASPLPGVLRTPHDWVMLTYLVYVVFTAPNSMSSLTGFLPLVAFYALTVQSLNSWQRLLSYLRWWTIALVILALMAVLIPYGIDITGGKGYTERFVGRLSLGTWLHNNPNALAHSAVVAIPVSYLLFFWRGTSLGKWLLFPLCAGLAYWCVYQTESKGAFLVGGIILVSVFVIGRPKYVQIGALVVALTLGVGALNFLPRMSQMGDLSSDEGVQGRLLAWDMARGISKTRATGAGWQEFVALIDWKEGNTTIHDIPKATHSSYVQVGADLGRYGLLIYVAGLWCALHTLLRFRPADDDQDRCRRILGVLLLATAVSGWMINRQYHAEYFLLIAAVAALHRLRKGEELAKETPDPSPEADVANLSGGLPPLRVASAQTPAFSTRKDDAEAPEKPFWNRLGVIDVVACIALTSLVFWVWDYILINI